jgi:hypothetical protein
VGPGTLYIRRQWRHNDSRAYPITRAHMTKIVAEQEQLGAGAGLESSCKSSQESVEFFE